MAGRISCMTRRKVGLVLEEHDKVAFDLSGRLPRVTIIEGASQRQITAPTLEAALDAILGPVEPVRMVPR